MKSKMSDGGKIVDALLIEIELLKSENNGLKQQLCTYLNRVKQLEKEAILMKNALSNFNGCDASEDRLKSDDIYKQRNGLFGDHNSNVSINKNQLLHDLLQDQAFLSLQIKVEETEKQRIHEQLATIKERIQNLNLSEDNDQTKIQLQNERLALQRQFYLQFGSVQSMMEKEAARMRHMQLIDQEIGKLHQNISGGLTIQENGNDLDVERDHTTCNGLTNGHATNDVSNNSTAASPEDVNLNMAAAEDSSGHKPPFSYQKHPAFENPDSLAYSRCVSFENVPNPPSYYFDDQNFNAKMETVYALLPLLGNNENEDLSLPLLAMASSKASCVAMRQFGCLSLLVQLLHDFEKDVGTTKHSREVRKRAAEALHNMVSFRPPDKRGRLEIQVLQLLENIRDYNESLRDVINESDEQLKKEAVKQTVEKHPEPSVCDLIKLSFQDEYRPVICQLGGLQTIAELILLDHLVHGHAVVAQHVTLMRYAGKILINLTYGDSTNKTVLCQMTKFMTALVLQMTSTSEELLEVTACVIRNLSWRATKETKKVLRDASAVGKCTRAALCAKKESTLRAILSALFNLSGHCSSNKADICAVDGALAFIVQKLVYKGSSDSVDVIEAAGGILRNISSHIAGFQEYRALLRQHNCIFILLQQLESPSLKIVQNACGTLMNLSSDCPIDQKTLLELGAVKMLRNLILSKHTMISKGSFITLRNLHKSSHWVPDVDSPNRSSTPSLHVRKQRALRAELDKSFGLNASTASKSDDEMKDQKLQFPWLLGQQMMRMYSNTSPGPLAKDSAAKMPRANSRDSISSNKSDLPHDRHKSLELLSRSSKLLSARSPSPVRQTELHDHSSREYMTRSIDSKLNKVQMAHSIFSDQSRMFGSSDVLVNFSQMYQYEDRPRKAPINSRSLNQMEPVDDKKSFCVEGTPRAQSPHTSSISSLDSADAASPEPSRSLQVAEDLKLGGDVLDAASRRQQDDVQETPMMFSRSSSLKSLDSCDPGPINDDNMSDHSQFDFSGVSTPGNQPDWDRSDTENEDLTKVKHNDSVNSFNEDGNDIIADLISSAKPTRKSKLPIPSAYKRSNAYMDDTIQVFQTEHTPGILSKVESRNSLVCSEDDEDGNAQTTNFNAKQKPANDMQAGDSAFVYTTENTPAIFSKGSSLSCLVTQENSRSASPVDEDGIAQSTNFNAKQQPANDMQADDSTFVYATENTPAIFSKGGSLSCLVTQENSRSGSPVAEEPKALNNSAQELPSPVMKLQPSSLNHETPEDGSHVKTSNEQASNSQCAGDDSLMVFSMEYTPGVLSKCESLSCLVSEDNSRVPSPDREVTNSMKRSDSVSSVESLGRDPTEIEQAMLSEFITSAKPKSKKENAS